MKLRNRKTGEIIEFDAILPVKDVVGDSVAHLEYGSLAELNAEWEDYEPDRRYWYIDIDGEIMSKEMAWFNQAQDNIGNCFETKEEAEKAVEKLKAVKRLKDKGFKFTNWEFRDVLDGELVIEAKLSFDNDSNIQRDLENLFGGEE